VAERARTVHAVGLENRWHDIDQECFERIAADLAAGRLDQLDRFLSFVADAQVTADTPPIPSPVTRTFGDLPPPGYTDLAPSSSVPPPPARASSETPPIPHVLADSASEWPDQAETKLRATELREAMVAAEKVATWSVERFSWAVAAEQQAPERAEAFWREQEILTQPARSAARRLWEKRLDRDSDLQEKHAALVEQYADGFRRGAEGEPPA
jgi:hypothetical protein